MARVLPDSEEGPMNDVTVYLVLLIFLYCGWVCGRSHERYHHRDGSVLWFGGKWGGTEETRKPLSDRVRGSHQCKGPGTFGGTYDIVRRGEEVFCSKCGAGPLVRSNGQRTEFDYEDGTFARYAKEEQ